MDDEHLERAYNWDEDQDVRPSGYKHPLVGHLVVFEKKNWHKKTYNRCLWAGCDQETFNGRGKYCLDHKFH